MNEGERIQQGLKELHDLDKALRSKDETAQYKALLLHYPGFLNRYGDTQLLQNSLLKLFDFYKDGSNTLRVWIYTSLKGCLGSYLDYLVSLDECIRRLLVVISSNDPQARSISLLTLGLFAKLAHVRSEVLSCLSLALTDGALLDEVEWCSLLEASGQYAYYSSTFYQRLLELALYLDALPAHRRTQLRTVLVRLASQHRVHS